MRICLSLLLMLWSGFAAAQQPPAPSPGAPEPKPDSKELASIEGKVTTQNGEPLRKVNLTLRKLGGAVRGVAAVGASDTAPQPYGATTEADGHFVFDGIEPGTYQLSAERAGYIRQTYGAKGNFSPGTNLTLLAGSRLKEITLKLIPQGTVSGKVLDEDGDPLRAQVRLLRRGFMSGRQQLLPAGVGTTDESGEYKITGLAPGRYFLSVVPQRMYSLGESTRRAARDGEKPEEDYLATYYPGVQEYSAASAITVTAGQDTPGIDLRLKKSRVYRIRGKVAGGLQDSTARYRVVLLPTGSIMGFVGTGGNLGKDGAFEIADVAPGTYTLMYVNMGGVLQVLAREEIAVSNQNLEGITLSAQPLGELTGSIKWERDPATEAQASPNQTAADAAKSSAAQTSPVRISLLPLEMLPIGEPSAIANEDGAFSISKISLGKYRISVSFAGNGYLKSIYLGDQEVSGNNLDLTRGVSGTLQVVLSTKGAKVEGVVKGDDQQNASGGVVTLVPEIAGPEHSSLYRQAIADQTGVFSIPNIAPGKYRLYAWEDLGPGDQFNVDLLKALSSAGVPVSVDENGHEQVTITRLSTATVEQARQRSGQ